MKPFLKPYLRYILIGTGTGTLLLLVGLYFFFQTPFSAWNLMPHGAMLVVETTDLPAAYQDLQKRPEWRRFRHAPYVQTLQNKLQTFLQTVEHASNRHTFWAQKRVSMSVHWVGKEDFDVLFYIPLVGKQDAQIYEQTLGIFKQQKGAKFSERELNGIRIYEVSFAETEEKFTFLRHHDFWVGSFSPLLLEDVSRKISAGEGAYTLPQASALRRTMRQMSFAPTHVEIFVNFPKLAEGVGKLFAERIPQELQSLGEWGSQAYLRLQAKQASWEGYTFLAPSKEKKKEPKEAKPFGFAAYMPQNAYLACSFAPDAQSWAGKNEDLQRLFAQISGNIALAYLTNEGKDEGSLLFLRVEKPLPFLATVQQWLKTSGNARLGERETLGNYTFQEILGWENVRKKLEIKGLKGFQKMYFAVLGQCVVLGNDRTALKGYLRDFQEQKTWENAPTYSQISPTLGTKSHFTLAACLPLWWGRAYEWVSPKFQMLLSIYENEIKQAGWFIWQNEAKEEGILTQARLFPDESAPATPALDTAKSEYTVLQQINFGDLLFTQPFLVDNAESGETEILIQDFRKNLYMLNEKGKVLWKRNMGGQLVGAPTQVDIYNNKRLQYAWSAGNKLHLIDRLGRNVPGFPVNMTDSTSNLYGISILDIQQNRDYLFTGCDERGRLFVLNKRMQWVAGWNPKRLAYRLGTPLRGVRVKGANYMVAIQENGQILAFNAKGEPLPNFPIIIKQRFTAAMHIEQGNTLASTVVTTVSEDGKLIQFNLAGKLLKEEQLDRPSGRSRFWLLQDAHREQYWFAVTTDTYWQLMNKNGAKIMEDETDEGAGKWEIQLFEPMPKVFVAAVTNKGEGKTSLYDMRGKMLGEALPSNAPIALRYDKKKKSLLVYRVLGNKLSILAKNIAL